MAYRDDGWASGARDSAAGAPVRDGITVLCSVAEFAALRPEWDRLAAACRATAFQSFAVARAAAEVLGAPAAMPVVVCLRRGGLLAGVLALSVQREGALRVGRMLGAPYVQYDDVVVDPNLPGVAEELLGAVLDRDLADALVFRRVRADAALAPVLARIGRETDSDHAPVVILDRGDVLAGLSGKKRQNLRRGRRDLEASGRLGFAVYRGAEAAPFVAHALALKTSWLAETGKISAALADPRAAPFLEAVARDRSGTLAVSVLSVGDRTAALEIGFIARDR